MAPRICFSVRRPTGVIPLCTSSHVLSIIFCHPLLSPLQYLISQYVPLHPLLLSLRFMTVLARYVDNFWVIALISYSYVQSLAQLVSGWRPKRWPQRWPLAEPPQAPASLALSTTVDYK